MSGNGPGDPEVHEGSGYLDSDLGPPEDTDVFYKGTPVMSARHDHAPAEARAAEDTQRIPRPSASASHDDGGSITLPSIPPLAIVAVGAFGFFMFGFLVVAWMLVAPATVDVHQAPRETQAGEEAKWEGLKVKKGLR
ncbi:MAG: hypothetical protein H6736_24235 [Alphaproteobacteria bacterium]|nr:hypothetical protein [Alphaproteobacteria bacterium]